MTTIDESASRVDLILVQGDSWTKTFRFGSRPDPESDVEYWDLTDWVGKSQIRKKATTPLLAELIVEIPTQTGSDLGCVTVSLDPDESAYLPSACVWDLELTNPSGLKKTYMAGDVTVEREVTREV